MEMKLRQTGGLLVSRTSRAEAPHSAVGRCARKPFTRARRAFFYVLSSFISLLKLRVSQSSNLPSVLMKPPTQTPQRGLSPLEAPKGLTADAPPSPPPVTRS